jgi:hypothetical protein
MDVTTMLYLFAIEAEMTPDDGPRNRPPTIGA